MSSKDKWIRWKKRIRNPKTRSIYVDWVERFCEYSEVSPNATLKWDLEKTEDRMEDFLVYLQSEYHFVMSKKLGRDFDPLSGNTLKQAWNALCRWFGDNRKHIRIKPRDIPKSRVYFDYIPNKDVLKMILGQAKLKYKVALSLIAYAGMRPVDVCNLRYENVSRSLSQNDDILSIKLKQRKTGDWYVTFLSPEGTKYLKQLLDLRRSKGERFKAKSYVVSITGMPLLTNTLRCYFNRLVDNITGKHPTGESFKRFRVYGLRKYFRKNIGRALDEAEAEYLMGHKAGLDKMPARYSGLADIDEDAISLLKEKYRSALRYLEVDRQESMIDALKRELSQYVTTEEMEDLTRGVGGGKAIKAEWDADTILAALQTALSNGQ